MDAARNVMPPKKQKPATSGNNGDGNAEPVKTEDTRASRPAEQTTTSTSTPVSVSSTPTSTPTPLSQPASVSRLSSAARGGKPALAPKPKFAGRRSATARAELEAAEAKKKEAEAKAAAEQAKRDAKDARKFGYRGNDRGGRGGGRGGRGRGGHMGDAHRQRQESNPTGIFGGGQASVEARTGWSGKRTAGGRDGGGGGGGLSGASSGGGGGLSRPTYTSGGMGIKHEHDVDISGLRAIKTEDGGYISSDEDEAEDQVGPKQNIDHLQVVDLTGDEQLPEDPFAPVRLSRLPHKERAVGLTVEADSAESSHVAEAISEKRKGKQKAREVEFTGSSAIPKRPTTYSSSETEEGDVPIKQESTEDHHQTALQTPESTSANAGAEITSPSQGLPISPESRRRAKARIRDNADALDDDISECEIPEPPRFQTQAEKDEWDRQFDDLRQIRNEFGRQVPKDIAQPDVEGDTAMAEVNAKLEKLKAAQESRNNNVYIFQFPPVLPDLAPVIVKPDPESAEANGHEDPMNIRKEVEKAAEVRDGEKPKNSPPKLPSGNVGKLRIHKSGKASLDWGGTSLVMSKGADATFLQNVLIASLPDAKPKESEVPPEDQDSAVGMAMGQIRGKFVFTPNWAEIFK